MITFYSGTPGSGKSYNMAKDIWFQLRFGRNVISTVNIDTDYVSRGGKRRGKKKAIGRFTYKSILELTPEFLYEYAYYNHKKGKEGQTLLIIDECQILFNPREYQMKNRNEWILFFTKHRHLGYKIIMTSQNDRLVDRQIRSLFETEVKHRKINNFGFLWMLPITIFVQISYWYGVRAIMRKNFSLFRKKYANIYDSYVMFDDFLAQKGFDTKNKEQEGGFDNISIPDTTATSSTAVVMATPKKKPQNIFKRFWCFLKSVFKPKPKFTPITPIEWTVYSPLGVLSSRKIRLPKTFKHLPRTIVIPKANTAF